MRVYQIKCYAYIPTKLSNGRWIWLRSYERRVMNFDEFCIWTITLEKY